MPSGFPALSSFSRSFGTLVRIGLPCLVVAELRSTGSSDHLLGRDAVNLFGVDAHKVLPAARDEVRLVAVVAKELHHLQHRLVNQIG